MFPMRGATIVYRGMESGGAAVPVRIGIHGVAAGGIFGKEALSNVVDLDLAFDELDWCENERGATPR